MRAEVTGAVRLEQPQYQASELLIGVITHGYKVAEVPATIHRRRVGESKKGQNPLYRLHIPGVNNFFYGMRFARVAYGTWWRERRRMRAEVTGAVRLEQPQYQASELLSGVITRGYKVAEVPATIHRRRVGESKKGQNPLYKLHIPGVNNFCYGLRFARVIYGTWWRERQLARQAGRAGQVSSEPAARANGSGPGSVEASASSAASGASRSADAKRT
jgi:hypothetical protein